MKSTVRDAAFASPLIKWPQAGWGWAKLKSGALSGSPMWAQKPKHFGHRTPPSKVRYGAGSEMEQPGLKSAPTWDISIAGLTFCDTMPVIFFSGMFSFQALHTSLDYI